MTANPPSPSRLVIARCPAIGLARIEHPANVVVLQDDLRLARRMARLVSQEAHAVRIAPLRDVPLRPEGWSRLDRNRRMLWADVVVVDLGEPDDERIDTLATIQRDHPHVAFVLCASHVDDPRVQRAADGRHPLVAKPFSSIELRAAVEQAAHRRSASQASREQAA